MTELRTNEASFWESHSGKLDAPVGREAAHERRLALTIPSRDHPRGLHDPAEQQAPRGRHRARTRPREDRGDRPSDVVLPRSDSPESPRLVARYKGQSLGPRFAQPTLRPVISVDRLNRFSVDWKAKKRLAPCFITPGRHRSLRLDWRIPIPQTMALAKDALSAVFFPTAKGPKVRRKLRKGATKQQDNVACQVGPNVSSYGLASNQSQATSGMTPKRSGPGLSAVPSFSLGSAKLGGRSPADGAHVQAQRSLEPPTPPRSPARIIPKFSQPLTNNTPAQESTCSSPPTSSTSKMRRRAKTPVFSIGQLEGIPRPSHAPGRASSVDLIADQYRALLEHRRTSLDTGSEPPSSGTPLHDEYGPFPALRRHSSEYLHDSGETRTSTPPPRQCSVEPAVMTGSPTSDDGTLVSFEEETVFFKPISFSPEDSPSSPLPSSPSLLPPPLPPARYSSPDHDGRDGSSSGNLGLQICLDLLTRELSSALAACPSRASSSSSSSCLPATSALQVWAMIEAYEALRDRLLLAGREQDSEREEWRSSLELMFDVWLRALYEIHESLTGGAGAGGR